MDSRKISAALALVLSFAGTVHAQAVGPTYKIIEKDMLDEIRATLEAKERSGELGKLKEEAITRSKNSILNPQAVDGIQRTDICRHLFLADFAEFLFLEQALQLFAQGNEFGAP